MPKAHATEVPEVEAVEAVETPPVKRSATPTKDERPPAIDGELTVDPKFIVGMEVLKGTEEGDDYYGKLVLRASSVDPLFKGSKVCIYYLHGKAFNAAYNALNGVEFTPEAAETVAASLAGLAVRVRETKKSVERNKGEKSFLEYNVSDQPIRQLTVIGPVFYRNS